MPPVDDGRASNAAPISEELDLPGFAFEFLRRNPDYAREASSQLAAHGEEGDDLARRWGLRFRP